MSALVCGPGNAGKVDLAITLYDIKLSSGKKAFDTYDSAKDASKLLKPLLDVFVKSGEAYQKRDPGKAVEAVGAMVSTAQYTSKLVDWEVAGKLFQQSAKTFGFVKALKMTTPQGQITAISLLATEKILLQLGFATKSQGMKCATSIATLAADGVALAALGAATGGVGAAFFAISFAWSVADATYQCAQLAK